MRTLIVTLVGLCSLAILAAQDPVMDFEVASIKPNISGDSSSASQTFADGTYRARNITARTLILEAFDLQSFAVAGGPAWLDSDRFDIIARAPAGAREEQIGGMLQRLLRSRFALEAHTEQRELPIYKLMLARPDGQFGPQLTRTARNCVDERANGPEVAPRAGIPPCGLNTSLGNAGGIMRGGGRTVAEIASALGNVAVARRVVDETGIKGALDFELQWLPVTATNSGNNAAADQVSIFTAVQEQLGLKLVSARGAVDVMVIDHIEQPTEN